MKIKRSGLIYSLYLKNILALWVVAALLMSIPVYLLIHNSGANYLMNYLFYRGAPDPAALAEYTGRDMLDYETVMADIDAHGGEQALLRQTTTCFFRANLYQEGDRYRFSIPIDRDKLVDTGIYYDNMALAYTGMESHEQLNQMIPKENYAVEHLYFYEYGGMNYLLSMDYDLDSEIPEKMRVTFAPIGIYSLYMVYDLYQEGYTGELCNYLIDCRSTPVDPEDEIFKDLCMFSPFGLAFLIAAILLTAVPTLHPTYRQLDKFARSIPKAVEKIEANYAEFGVEDQDKKTIYLNEWLIKKSLFKTNIERNYKKQPN